MNPPAPGCSEQEWQRWVTDRVEEVAGWWFHVTDSKRAKVKRGHLDLEVFLTRAPKGAKRVLWRELKTDDGTLSPEQERELVKLRSIGEDAGVWRPADWERVLRELHHPAAYRPAPLARPECDPRYQQLAAVLGDEGAARALAEGRVH